MPVPLIHRPVLVLNSAYEPLHFTTAKRAMTLITKGSACVQEASKFYLRTSAFAFPLPSVIRLLSYRYVPRHSRAVSRKAIFLRDSWSCQYCGVTGVAPTLTLDHVIPKSRGGRTSWENLATCCFACNNRKGSRTPDEAGMPLKSRPRPFGFHAKHRQTADLSNEPVWNTYLFF